MCGGSSGGGQQQTLGSWSPEISPYWHKYLDQGEQIAGQPYQQYDGQRIADLHPAQISAFDNINNLAVNGGTPLSRAADDTAYRTLGGDFLIGGSQANPAAGMGNQFAGMRNPFGTTENESAQIDNPWTQNIWGNVITQTHQNDQAGNLNQFSAMAANPWAMQGVSTDRNQFSGMNNPAFQDMLRQGMGEITDAYQKGTAAETQKNFNLAGIFGGGAMNDAVNQNQQQLAKNLSNFASGMYNDQYNRSAGLEESYLGRDLGAQQFGSQLGADYYQNELGRVSGLDENRLNRLYGAGESFLDRDLQNQQSNKSLGGQWYEDRLNRAYTGEESQLGRANSDFESMLGRLFSGGESQLGRVDSAYENERNRMQGAIPFGSQNISDAMKLYQGQLGVGDSIRGYTQDLLNQQYGDWQDQQNYGARMNDWMTGLLSRSMGGMSPSSTTTTGGYQASPFSQLFGAALLGNQFGLFGK